MTALAPPAAQAQHILEAMIAEGTGQYAAACVYYAALRQIEPIAEAGVLADAALRSALWSLLEALAAEPLAAPRRITLASAVPWAGVVFPFFTLGELVGMAAVLDETADGFSAARAQQWAAVVHTILENLRLHHHQRAAHAIQYAVQIVGKNPSPQDLVDVLHDRICGPHVTLCALLFYGPVREDRPHGPFDYLEVQGSWTRRFGGGVGLGMRLYLDDYVTWLADLNDRKALTFSDASQFYRRLDPLARAFLRAERAQALAIIELATAQRRVGIMAIATHRPYRFDPHELNSYYAVGEFLAMSVVAQGLQQRHDLVQRGRAALLDAVTDGVLMVLPHPVDGATTLTVNECFTEMFGVSQAAAEGVALDSLLDRLQIPDDARQELRRQWFSVPVRAPTTQRGEFSMVRPGGAAATIEWYSAPVYQSGRVMGRIYTFHDVSAERAAAKLRADFISWISHELRTPLTLIRGFAEFILEACRDDLPDLAREYTEIILSSAKHLNRVFTDIIEIARADTGQIQLNLEQAHLSDLIIEAAALLEPQSRERGQMILMALDDELPPVEVDAIRIKQALVNVIGNAIQHAPAGSRIRISTQYVEAAQALPAGAPRDVLLPGILISVQDDGPGLTPEDAEKVFLPFYRARQASGSKIEGTGLGLTIARSLVELHQGKIWAEPRRRGRRGGRFLLALPVAARSAPTRV